MTKKVKDKCPREAMKEVRADVKAYVDGANPLGLDHLGDYPADMETARRTIIALQDLLERSMERHEKASDHVHELIQTQDQMVSRRHIENTMIQMVQSSNEATLHRLMAVVKERDEMLSAMKQELDETRDDLHDAYQQISELQSNQGAVMQTLHIAMGG